MICKRGFVFNLLIGKIVFFVKILRKRKKREIWIEWRCCLNIRVFFFYFVFMIMKLLDYFDEKYVSL